MTTTITYYKIYNEELLVIIQKLTTQKYYLKSYKFKIFIPINYINFCRFIDIKNLSLR